MGDERVKEIGNYIRKGKIWEAFENTGKSVLLIDEIDKDERERVEQEGVECVITNTIMESSDLAASLCRTVLASGN